MDCITNYLCCCFVSETDPNTVDVKQPLINNENHGSNRITSKTATNCKFLMEMDDLEGTKLKVGLNKGLDIALKVASFYKTLIAKADEGDQEAMNSMHDDIKEDIATVKAALAPNGSAVNLQNTLSRLYSKFDELSNKIAALDLNPKGITLLDHDGNINVDDNEDEEEEHEGNLSKTSIVSRGSSSIPDDATAQEVQEMLEKLQTLQKRWQDKDKDKQ